MKRADVNYGLILGLALALNLSLKEEALACNHSKQGKAKVWKAAQSPKSPTKGSTLRPGKSLHSEKPKLPVLIGPASLLLSPWLSHLVVTVKVDTAA